VAYNGPRGGYTCKYHNGRSGLLSLTMSPTPYTVSSASWEKLFTRNVTAVDGRHGQNDSDHYVHGIAGLGYLGLLSFQEINHGGASATVVNVVWLQGRVYMHLETSSLVVGGDGNPITGAQALTVAHAVAAACQNTLCRAKPLSI
jgi:hypothetical protein